jgi:hypothetical protein
MSSNACGSAEAWKPRSLERSATTNESQLKSSLTCREKVWCSLSEKGLGNTRGRG